MVGYTRPQDRWLGHRSIVYTKVQTAEHRLGISVSQIQRNERRLMELGATAFRDSGNFRRSGRRDGRRIAGSCGLVAFLQRPTSHPNIQDYLQVLSLVDLMVKEWSWEPDLAPENPA